MKYLLKLAYDGSNYSGWQKQINANSIQETIEKAFYTIFQANIELVGCGRTDAGVHAREYFAHFETEIELGNLDVTYKLNSILPEEIAIYTFHEIDESFHSRFSALKREYKYYIHFHKNPFLIKKSHFLHKPLDINLMNEACQQLLSTDDFASFCKKGADNFTTLCQVTNAHWEMKEDQIIFCIISNRFLRNMVRSIVGCMLDIGLHKINLEQFITIINAKNPSFTGTSVPAHGLYLNKITYPELFKIV